MVKIWLRITFIIPSNVVGDSQCFEGVCTIILTSVLRLEVVCCSVMMVNNYLTT